MTEGKLIQDFIKSQKKTAKEMWEENGWDATEYVDGICYSNEKSTKFITFHYKTKTYQVCSEKAKCNIDMKLNRLIQYQIQELGWL